MYHCTYLQTEEQGEEGIKVLEFLAQYFFSALFLGFYGFDTEVEGFCGGFVVHSFEVAQAEYFAVFLREEFYRFFQCSKDFRFGDAAVEFFFFSLLLQVSEVVFAGKHRGAYQK